MNYKLSKTIYSKITSIMKKILFTLILSAFAATNSMAQDFVYAPINNDCQPLKVQTAKEGLEWVHHYNLDAGIGGIGPSSMSEASAVARFSKEFLQDYKGKEIKAVAIGLRYAGDNITLYIKKGDEIETAETIQTKELSYLGAGWNYVVLDTPIAINGEETINIEYSLKTDETVFGQDINNKAAEGCSYICLGGKYYDMVSFQAGNITIGGLVGGDVNDLSRCVSLNEITGIPELAPKFSEMDIDMTLSNNSFKDVSSMTVYYSINGEAKNEEISFDEAIAPYSVFSHNMTIDVPEEDFDMELCITKVNGDTNLANDTLKRSVMVYEPDNTGNRVILLEKFTGQDCSICPSGEKSIQQAILGQEDRVARIDHHYGYYNDLFTIDESIRTGEFFGVRGAPSCMIDRTKVEGQNDVVFHPGNLKGTDIFKELQKPADVSISISTTYDKNTRKLNVIVKGESEKDLAEKRINVVLTQSGYEAYQNNGEEGYLHNDFPIIYMTEYNGDALSANEDGSYNMTFECEIPESFSNDKGTRNVDLNQLKVVAFISEWKDRNSSEVMNAAFLKVDPEKSAVENIAATEAPVFTITDGTVTTEACCSSVEVYDLSGTRIANRQLARGIYIVKAECNNIIYTQKVVAD